MTDQEFESLKNRVPMGRVATPDEVADSVLFLLSNRSSFITGVALPIDGGISAIWIKIISQINRILLLF